jgi:hypothetical protein
MNALEANRRALISLMIGASTLPKISPAMDGAGSRSSPAIDVKVDYGAIGDGRTDDTRSLQLAINDGATRQVPVHIPPGVYATTRALQVPANTQLLGSAPAANFACCVVPHGCPAFQLGREAPCFHALLENILIFPQGPAAPHVLEVGNSYSCTFRNIRIHNAPSSVQAAVLLRSADKSSGIEPCSSITWHNLIVRNDSEQPLTAIQASPRCGTHRFYGVDLENYQTLLHWQGGQLDLVAPYMERAGRYGVHCAVSDAADEQPALHSFGGTVSAADSGVALGVHSRVGAFSSYGTLWGFSSRMAAYFYAVPEMQFSFHDTFPNLGANGAARFSGVEGWNRGVSFPDWIIKARVPVALTVPPHERRSIHTPVPGALHGKCTVQVSLTGDAYGAIPSAYVSANDVVTLTFVNPTASMIKLESLVAALECRAA